jgi:hypothetical protein
MIRASPPVKKVPPTRQDRGQEIIKRFAGYDRATPRASYWRLLTNRLGQGLLEPFVCAGCGAVALDPIGWNGRRQPLCASCADGTEVPR